MKEMLPTSSLHLLKIAELKWRAVIWRESIGNCIVSDLSCDLSQWVNCHTMNVSNYTFRSIYLQESILITSYSYPDALHTLFLFSAMSYWPLSRTFGQTYISWLNWPITASKLDTHKVHKWDTVLNNVTVRNTREWIKCVHESLMMPSYCSTAPEWWVWM